ncbi:uncharacterized protein [Aegilops tauschii subsp. strangulata]|uniref:uncharacterized protein n=1 Tax=Aegilops tauschii subsp. strangulata TaxID=200361 RepID=UPI003CC8A069
MFWKAWAPPCCKFFTWLLMLDRLWCADRLQRRGWLNDYFCPLCVRNLESSVHLLWQCPVARTIWAAAAGWHGCAALAPSTWPEGDRSEIYWAHIIDNTQAEHRKRIRSLTMLITWELWLERNRRVFHKKIAAPWAVIQVVRGSLEAWRLAGAKCLQHLFGNPT